MIPDGLSLSENEKKERINLLNAIDRAIRKNTKTNRRLKAFVKVQVIDL